MASADDGSGVLPQRKYVFVVRHGERLDSVDETWRSHASRPHDPPLSPAGVKQAYAAGRLIHQRVVAERGVDSAADIGVFSSPFLRCVQSAKALSTGYYDQLQGRQKVDFDVQIKIEHGLAEFLTPRQQRQQPKSSSRLADRLPPSHCLLRCCAATGCSELSQL